MLTFLLVAFAAFKAATALLGAIARNPDALFLLFGFVIVAGIITMFLPIAHSKRWGIVIWVVGCVLFVAVGMLASFALPLSIFLALGIGSGFVIPIKVLTYRFVNSERASALPRWTRRLILCI